MIGELRTPTAMAANPKKLAQQLKDEEALLTKHDLLPELERFARDEGGRLAFIAYHKATVAALRPLGKAVNPEQVRQAVAAVHKVIQEAQAELENQFVMLPQGGKAKIACKAGCGWCCVIRVGATPAEILSLADRLKATRTDAEMDELRAEAQHYAYVLAPLDNQAKRDQRMPCPLLKDGSCTAHTHRPSNCRGYNSLDVNACKAGVGQRPTHPLHKMVEQAASEARDRVFSHFGIPVTDTELVSGLALALTDTEAWAKLLRSENPFESVPYPVI